MAGYACTETVDIAYIQEGSTRFTNSDHDSVLNPINVYYIDTCILLTSMKTLPRSEDAIFKTLWPVF